MTNRRTEIESRLLATEDPTPRQAALIAQINDRTAAEARTAAIDAAYGE